MSITAAPIALSQELIAALGVLNFDFSLVKIEAPMEYKAVGAALAPSHRIAAEEGDIHSIARKLRSLFDQVIPETPSLNKAYGLRASEIASSPNFRAKSPAEAGPFAEHIGIDGSSIWAAVTSGPGAIAIHLLACMLARIWPAAEATSIWMEIVAKRKQDITQIGNDDYHRHMAANSSISRSQLADWDASARAWLRAADETNMPKQKQLHLIIDNIRMPVNIKTDVYGSVLQAWTTAMRTMDRLIEGIPQSIHDGAALLGLSAWHLYPDMIVLGSTATDVKQQDPLIDSRGIITLGLSYVGRKQDAEALQANEEGIFWSLPLAHLRFYGRPVPSNSALSINQARLNIGELVWISLGSLFRSWGQLATDYTEAMKCLVSYWKLLGCSDEKTKVRPDSELNPYETSSSSWLGVLAREAEFLLACSGEQQREALRLFNYGRRRNLKFLVPDQHRPPAMFGLCKPAELLSIICNDHDRVAVLRLVAQRLGVDPQGLVIRYRKTDGVGKPGTHFHYASVVPIEVEKNPPAAKNKPALKEHRRWLTGSRDQNPEVPHLGTSVRIAESDIIGPIGENTKFFWCNAPSFFSKKKYDNITADEYFGQFAEFALFRGKVDNNNPRIMTGIPFDLVFGNADTAAIYRVVNLKNLSRPEISNVTEFSLDEINWALRNSRLRPGALFEQAVQCLLQYPAYVVSLKALATVCAIYATLEGATFPMSITRYPLSEARWVPVTAMAYGKKALDKENQTEKMILLFEPFLRDRALSFACVAGFECGGRSISPEGLQDVMAMAAGDSIYIASSLLCDPFASFGLPNYELRRVRGNIGRAGIGLMIPPRTPEIREFDQNRWRFVNHFDFDGNLRDCFKGTSLHLSFTNYVFPVDTGQYGACDMEVYILETLISVHDEGSWVADLDILSSLKNKLFRPIEVRNGCVHSEVLRGSPTFDDTLVSIDCWDEFLDFPGDAAVIRAHENWVARLAIIATSVQRGYLTLLLGPERCWQCAYEERQRFRHQLNVAYIL